LRGRDARLLRGLLGLEELAKPEALRGRGGCWFALPDGRQLHVGVEQELVAAAKAHPAFRVAGYDALRDLLAGAEDDAIPGVRRFYAQTHSELASSSSKSQFRDRV
jgi:hypothetical protein